MSPVREGDLPLKFTFQPVPVKKRQSARWKPDSVVTCGECNANWWTVRYFGFTVALLPWVSTLRRTTYSTGCKHFVEKRDKQILALAEEMCETQISGVRVNMLGDCRCSLPFSYTLARTFAAVHSQKEDTGLEGSLISPYTSTLIAQPAPSSCRMYSGKNKLWFSWHTAKRCQRLWEFLLRLLLDAGVKDQIVRGREIFLCRVMTLLCVRRKELDWQELWSCLLPTTRQFPVLEDVDCSMHCCLKALAFLQASREILQKDALPSPKIEGKPGVSLLAAKIPLKTTFNPSIFALFDEKGCHHSKDFF